MGPCRACRLGVASACDRDHRARQRPNHLPFADRVAAPALSCPFVVLGLRFHPALPEKGTLVLLVHGDSELRRDIKEACFCSDGPAPEKSLLALTFLTSGGTRGLLTGRWASPAPRDNRVRTCQSPAGAGPATGLLLLGDIALPPRRPPGPVWVSETPILPFPVPAAGCPPP